jgi:hypothetical protein
MDSATFMAFRSSVSSNARMSLDLFLIVSPWT